MHVSLILCLCSILGGILIVAGLYSVLWGKYKEHKEREAAETSESNEVGMEKAKANEGVLAITIPMPEVAKA